MRNPFGHDELPLIKAVILLSLSMILPSFSRVTSAGISIFSTSSSPFSLASMISSRVCASSILKYPDAVRVSAVITAPQPSARPISSHTVRMYVPFEQLMSNSISPLSRSRYVTSLANTVISRGFISKAFPSRARSYALLPSILMAEYFGGICITCPV